MIENPFDSYLWLSPWMVELRADVPIFDVVFCQCAYGLQLPGCEPHCFCMKRTRIWSSFDVSQLERPCPGKTPTHLHEYAQGSRRVNGKTVKLAAAAGAYPLGLCNAIAVLVRNRLVHMQPSQ